MDAEFPRMDRVSHAEQGLCVEREREREREKWGFTHAGNGRTGRGLSFGGSWDVSDACGLVVWACVR